MPQSPLTSDSEEVDYHPSLCPAGSPIYKSLMVYGQYLRSTEEVLKFVGDEFLRTLATEINNYNPDKSDFCKGISGYDFAEEICGYLGTYSFPSCGEINFITTVYEQDEEGYPTCGWVRDGRYIIEVSEDGHIMILKRFDGETTWANWVYYSMEAGLANPMHWFE